MIKITKQSISEILPEVITLLSACSETPKLDAELMLSELLQWERVRLITEHNHILEQKEVSALNIMVERRVSGEPLAYILGYKHFWTLELKVTEDTLVPRPETELLVEEALKLLPSNKAVRVADLGTGTGAIALALARERPLWSVDAVDCSYQALEVAADNAARYGLDKRVFFKRSHWLNDISFESYDLIVSNPPYIAENDSALKSDGVKSEPLGALVADNNGLADLEKIMVDSRSYLRSGGFLILEHGADQQSYLLDALTQNGYQNVYGKKDLQGNPRFVVAVWKK